MADLHRRGQYDGVDAQRVRTIGMGKGTLTSSTVADSVELDYDIRRQLIDNKRYQARSFEAIVQEFIEGLK
jgi:hypothetical protein